MVNIDEQKGFDGLPGKHTNAAVNKSITMISGSEEPPVSVDKVEKQPDRVAVARAKMNQSKIDWKNESINFLMPDSKGKYIGCATKRIGVTHINSGKDCQDSCSVISEKEFTIVAVADGHGDESHDLSKDGSRIACEQLCELVKVKLSDKKSLSTEYFSTAEFGKDIVSKWEKSVLTHHEKKFGTEGMKAGDKNILIRYGTTLLFAFVYNGFYVVGQLGDGGIIILNKEDSKNGIHKKLTSKKIGSGTASLCMEHADDFFDIKPYPEDQCDGIVLMTDGYYDLWVSDEKRIEASRFFINALLTEPNPGKIEQKFTDKYNEAVDFVADDISIGVLTPLNGTSISTNRSVDDDITEGGNENGEIE